MSARPCSARRRRHAGYALFEALVAVIVLSVGFVGAARMQTVGLKLNNSAHSRQKATLLAYQMADRIRANPRGAYVDAVAGDAACLSATAGCDETEMVGADVAQWQADLAAQLPAGGGAICLDSSDLNDTAATAASPQCDGLGNVVVVKVFWTDTVATGGSVFATGVRR
jgi:type IV pilus assembly protein PilV